MQHKKTWVEEEICASKKCALKKLKKSFGRKLAHYIWAMFERDCKTRK